MHDDDAAPPEPRRRARPALRVAAALVIGVIVVPFGLSLLVNGSGPTDAEGFVRAAFAVVVGQTIAILTATALWVGSILRRAGVLAQTLLGLAFVGVATTGVALIAREAQVLLERLGAG
jgi:hypothetical protein